MNERVEEGKEEEKDTCRVKGTGSRRFSLVDFDL